MDSQTRKRWINAQVRESIRTFIGPDYEKEANRRLIGRIIVSLWRIDVLPNVPVERLSEHLYDVLDSESFDLRREFSSSSSARHDDFLEERLKISRFRPEDQKKIEEEILSRCAQSPI